MDIAQFKGMPSSSAHLQIMSNDGKYQYVKLVTTPSEEARAITSSGKICAYLLDLSLKILGCF